MSRLCYNQFGRVTRTYYGMGPDNAGTTTVNAPALPSITRVPNPMARPTMIPPRLKQTDGKQIPGYTNPDAINVGQGTNHKGNQ